VDRVVPRRIRRAVGQQGLPQRKGAVGAADFDEHQAGIEPPPAIARVQFQQAHHHLFGLRGDQAARGAHHGVCQERQIVWGDSGAFQADHVFLRLARGDKITERRLVLCKQQMALQVIGPGFQRIAQPGQQSRKLRLKIGGLDVGRLLRLGLILGRAGVIGRVGIGQAFGQRQVGVAGHA